MYNCGVVLGANALVVLGFKVFHSNGKEVPAQCEPGESQPSVSVISVLQVTDKKNVCLGPRADKDGVCQSERQPWYHPFRCCHTI